MECILVSISHNCVTCVGATIESGAHIIVLGKDVNKLPFAFVTPLGAQNDTESGVQTISAPGALLNQRLLEHILLKTFF